MAAGGDSDPRPASGGRRAFAGHGWRCSGGLAESGLMSGPVRGQRYTSVIRVRPPERPVALDEIEPDRCARSGCGRHARRCRPSAQASRLDDRHTVARLGIRGMGERPEPAVFGRSRQAQRPRRVKSRGRRSSLRMSLRATPATRRRRTTLATLRRASVDERRTSVAAVHRWCIERGPCDL